MINDDGYVVAPLADTITSTLRGRAHTLQSPATIHKNRLNNQAGIGRGYYTPEDFHVLMDWVGQQFLAHGGALDAVYYCPHHPEHGIGEYRQDSEDRKPGPGMLLRAARELDIDLARSLMVGDKVSDALAGQAAGLSKLFYFGAESDTGPAAPIAHLVDLIPYLEN